MIGSKALVHVKQPDPGEVTIEATNEKGRTVTLTMDLAEGMQLADELHVKCWRRPESWGKAPAAEPTA